MTSQGINLPSEVSQVSLHQGVLGVKELIERFALTKMKFADIAFARQMRCLLK